MPNVVLQPLFSPGDLNPLTSIEQRAGDYCETDSCTFCPDAERIRSGLRWCTPRLPFSPSRLCLIALVGLKPYPTCIHDAAYCCNWYVEQAGAQGNNSIISAIGRGSQCLVTSYRLQALDLMHSRIRGNGVGG
jgi:hypothetical protein